MQICVMLKLYKGFQSNCPKLSWITFSVNYLKCTYCIIIINRYVRTWITRHMQRFAKMRQCSKSRHTPNWEDVRYSFPGETDSRDLLGMLDIWLEIPMPTETILDEQQLEQFLHWFYFYKTSFLTGHWTVKHIKRKLNKGAKDQQVFTNLTW